MLTWNPRLSAVSAPDTFRIALAQLDLFVGDVDGNVGRMVEAARLARERDHADLVLFPELALSGYPPEDLLFHGGMRRRVAPLARRGIRVAGVRVMHGGPPVSDLRYFHSADRAEAATINRALVIVGKPAQRLRYVPGLERQEPRNRYELWLPAP